MSPGHPDPTTKMNIMTSTESSEQPPLHCIDLNERFHCQSHRRRKKKLWPGAFHYVRIFLVRIASIPSPNSSAGRAFGCNCPYRLPKGHLFEPGFGDRLCFLELTQNLSFCQLTKGLIEKSVYYLSSVRSVGQFPFPVSNQF